LKGDQILTKAQIVFGQAIKTAEPVSERL
jgi:hypothetical protein